MLIKKIIYNLVVIVVNKPAFALWDVAPRLLQWYGLSVRIKSTLLSIWKTAQVPPWISSQIKFTSSKIIWDLLVLCYCFEIKTVNAYFSEELIFRISRWYTGWNGQLQNEFSAKIILNFWCCTALIMINVQWKRRHWEEGPWSYYKLV